MSRSATTRLATLLLAWSLAGSAGAVTVSIEAGPDEELEAALAGASLVRELQSQGDATAQDLVAAAQADYRRLLTALYNEGFYGPVVSILIDGREAATIPPVGGPTQVQSIAIRVEPGPAFTFGRTEVAPVPPGTDLPEEFAAGQPARTAVIRRAVRTGVSGWREAGHARAEVAGEDIVAVHPQERLDVAVALAPGRRYTFGPLLVSGNEDVRTRRIVQIAGLPTGEIYDPDAVQRATERLRRTGAFSSVVLREAETDGPGDTLPVTAEVVEQAPRRIGFGIEVSSIDGLGVSAFWLHRNLLGGAERFRAELEVDQIGLDGDRPDFGLNLSFSRPGTFGLDRDLYATLELEDAVDQLVEVRAAEAELGLTQLVGEDLTLSAGLGLRYAEVTTGFFDVEYLLVTLPLSATLDRRDDALDPASGYYLDAEVTPFVGIENAENGVRLFTDARVYRSFGAESRLTFAGRLQIGSLSGPVGVDAPTDFLFYSGGGGTVRGQPFESLGVEVPGGEIGGNSFLGTQLEARYRIRDNIEAVAFYDYGMVGADTFVDEDSPSHAGAGIGARYLTGVGPIRVDIATPVSGDNAGESVELYIGIGQAF
ncbi:autotransporter assembly complex protein TamA [Histidinibacterium lentulum]|uniref:Outer membrane protein assembly factor n=1 Tax=Histidinibacterium lentulum TaxID=2480588 RepID=A0A3N2R896_9RHOB|nr:autotransporter assembly complex family protein [Histidinibacterium lentulum]ROU03601.1 outer membrane protein assembly factor [Histidinibacterium lentulum]